MLWLSLFRFDFHFTYLSQTHLHLHYTCMWPDCVDNTNTLLTSDSGGSLLLWDLSKLQETKMGLRVGEDRQPGRSSPVDGGDEESEKRACTILSNPQDKLMFGMAMGPKGHVYT